MNHKLMIENIIEKAKCNGEFLEKSIPFVMMEMDIELNKVINEILILTAEEKNTLSNEITVESAWTLLNFAMNMATYALRTSEQRYFTNGLIALELVLNILDKREILILMPLYYDLFKRHNMSFEVILNQNNKFSDFVKAFIDRDDENKTLECMGFILSKDKNENITYVRTW